MTSLSDSSVFAYDANGNMVSRTQGGITTCHTFNAENRLVTVERLSGGTCDDKEGVAVTTVPSTGIRS